MSYSLVISGAGTGGHLFPALAVLEELRCRDERPERVICLTSNRAIEQTILAGASIEQVQLPSFDSVTARRSPVKSMRALAASVRQADLLLKSLHRPVLISMGGAGSLPGAIAAWRNRIPLILLEQNAVAGRATSVVSPLATKICFSYPDTGWVLGGREKGILTGNPVRKEIARLADQQHLPDRRGLLILGGSQGARILNQSMERFVQQYSSQLAGWRIFHQAGESSFRHTQSVYDQAGLTADCVPFFNNMADIYQQTGLVISRAGGTSLAELACAGLPSLLVPYPRSIRRHQERNAKYFEARDAAVSLDQLKGDFDGRFCETLNLLLEDRERRRIMAQNMKACGRPNAARDIADLICQTLNMHAVK